MSSLKKRAVRGMVIGIACLLAGTALLYFAHDSFDHALKEAFVDIEKKSEAALVIQVFVGSLPSAAGIGLTIIGLFLLPFFIAVWIRNPPPGSKLTLHGWETPE